MVFSRPGKRLCSLPPLPIFLPSGGGFDGECGLMRDHPACHVFSVGSDEYAYDLNTQQILKVEPELAVVLRGEDGGSEAAKAVLREAQVNEGLSQPIDHGWCPGIRNQLLMWIKVCNILS